MIGGTSIRTARTGVAVMLLVALAACAAPTPYQPADGGYGFSEQRLEDNRYRITFAGNAETARETVQNYLLFRAAEITLETGHDYFTIVNQDVERSTRYFGTVDPLFASGRLLTRDADRFGSIGYGTYTAHGVDSYAAFADVLVHEGEKPAGDVNAYDARDVIEQLRPVIVRGAQG